MEKTTEEAIRLWVKTASLESIKWLLEIVRAELTQRGASFDYCIGSLPPRDVEE